MRFKACYLPETIDAESAMNNPAIPKVGKAPKKPQKGMARISKNPANIKLRKAKKQTVTDLMREWELPKSYIKAGKTALRYRDPIEKGILWYWFARYIRMRDFVDWGRCISCDLPKSFEELQAGHFVPADYCGLGLLFDEQNNNGECEGCNAFDGFHLVGYKKNLAIRFGNGVVENLEERRDRRNKDLTKFSRLEYLQKAAHYKAEFEALLSNL